MSQRLAASVRRLKSRVRGFRARRALAKVEKQRQRRERRQRIEAAQPEGFYEGLLAVRYEIWQLGAEVKSLLPKRPSGGGGMLDGLRETLAAVDEAAGDLDLDGDGGQFGVETELEQDVELEEEADLEMEKEVGFDPWTAGEPRERQ